MYRECRCVMEHKIALERAQKSFITWGEEKKRITNEINNLGKLVCVFIGNYIKEIPSLGVDQHCKRYIEITHKQKKATKSNDDIQAQSHKYSTTYTEKQVKELENILTDEKDRRLTANWLIRTYWQNNMVFQALTDSSLNHLNSCMTALSKIKVSADDFCNNLTAMKKTRGNICVDVERLKSLPPDFSAIILVAEMEIRTAHVDSVKRLHQIEAYLQGITDTDIVEVVVCKEIHRHQPDMKRAVHAYFDTSLEKGFREMQKRGDKVSIALGSSIQTRGDVTKTVHIPPYVHNTAYDKQLQTCDSLLKQIELFDRRVGMLRYGIKHLPIGTAYSCLKDVIKGTYQEISNAVDEPAVVLEKALAKKRRDNATLNKGSYKQTPVMSGTCYVCNKNVKNIDSVVYDERTYTDNSGTITKIKHVAHQTCADIRGRRQTLTVDHVSESDDEMEVDDSGDLKKKLASALSERRAADNLKFPIPTPIISKGLCIVCNELVNNGDRGRERHPHWTKRNQPECDPDQGYIHASCAKLVPFTDGVAYKDAVPVCKPSSGADLKRPMQEEHKQADDSKEKLASALAERRAADKLLHPTPAIIVSKGNCPVCLEEVNNEDHHRVLSNQKYTHKTCWEFSNSPKVESVASTSREPVRTLGGAASKRPIEHESEQGGLLCDNTKRHKDHKSKEADDMWENAVEL